MKRIPFIAPKRLPEANIQAELYRRLKMRHIDCYLEHRIRGVGRLDLIVVDNGHIVCIVECKSYRQKSKAANYDTRQVERYKALGVPLIILKHFDEVDAAVDTIISIISLHGAD